MVDIYGRPFIKIKSKTKTEIDLSKYAIKDEVDDFLNVVGVDPDEVAIFQDKQEKLKTSNIKRNDIIRRVLELPRVTSLNLLTVVESKTLLYQLKTSTKK